MVLQRGHIHDRIDREHDRVRGHDHDDHVDDVHGAHGVDDVFDHDVHGDDGSLDSMHLIAA